MSTELQLRGQDSMDLIRLALQGEGTPNEKAALVKELVSLQQSMERFDWERQERQARIDFDDALNRCQGAVDQIAPNQTRENNIAWLDYIGLNKVLRPIYSAEGFSISYSELPPTAPGRIRIQATLSRGGISRDYVRELSSQSSNSKMSTVDGEASAGSRVKRYLLIQIFNIAVGIDKDEKEVSDEVREACNRMLACDTLPALKAEFQSLYQTAKANGDKSAKMAFLDAYDAAQKKFLGGPK